MQQLFQNLFSKAMKYRGVDAPVIKVAAVRRESEWLFSVSDNGMGIAPEATEKIFGLFQHLHSAAQYPGTGVGLAMCRKNCGALRWEDLGGIRIRQRLDVLLYVA